MRRNASTPSGTAPAGEPLTPNELPPALTPARLSLDVFRGGVSEKTLSKWRLEGRGPRFRRRGHPTRGRVVYLREDVLAWLQSLPSATTTTEERLRVERTAA